ncbi:MAG: hypothetical protein IJB84_03670 [Lachnospiraceae bacterium]|nr:hypothetical protein [Lachnospiraceae bacterium]
MSKERILAYIERLYGVTKNIEDRFQNEKIGDKDVKNMTGTDFENVVYDSLIEAGFEKEEISHSAQKFPDFVLEDLSDGDKIGVEVKKTDGAKWEVIGGSIYESLKNDIEDTYVLMAKLGGDKPEVRLRKYEECIDDLKVTHSPRFYLNLDLEEGKDYLTRNDAKDLLELSGDELNRKIRKLLRTQKSTWWSEGETVAFSDLPQEEKGIYLNEGIALFPEVFRGDYRKFTPWLVYSCFVWCGNVRDIFSAGGNKYVEDMHIYVSAIMYRALQNVENIRQRIVEMTEDEQIKFWGTSTEDINDRIEKWLQLVEDNLKISTDLVANNRKLSIYENYEDERICLSIKNVYMSRLNCEMKKGI